MPIYHLSVLEVQSRGQFRWMLHNAKRKGSAGLGFHLQVLGQSPPPGLFKLMENSVSRRVTLRFPLPCWLFSPAGGRRGGKILKHEKDVVQ